MTRLILPLLAASSLLAHSADFYVAPNGADTFSGTLPKTNVAQTDGPFATLDRARLAVRELKSENPTKNILVQIREGNYPITETVTFTPKDSAEESTTITYAAYPDETPTFHSDIPITDWKKLPPPYPSLPKAAKGKVWVADVPKNTSFFTLYHADTRLPRARSTGFIPAPPIIKSRTSKNHLHYPEGTIKNWPNLKDVELIVRPHHAWVVNILPIASINPKKRIATTSLPATYSLAELHFLKGTESVWIENTLDSLNQPGEWVLDTQKGKLYLWPTTKGRPADIARPALQEYIRIEGDSDIDAPTDTPVRNLNFQGITFTRGESYRVTAGDKGLQHDWEFHDKANALFRLRGAENCVVEHCHFTTSGGTAIRADLHSQNNKIQSNHIEHIGATGILLCGYGPGTKDANHHNLVYNNHIHHVGEIYPHAPGIFLWQSGENRVAHNLVHHTPYAGIIISGMMTEFFAKHGNNRELINTIRWHEVGERPEKASINLVRPFLHTHDNLIEYNEIHHAMEELADGNGIYIRGAGAGNTIRRNSIHHLLSPVVMQSAIRTDGGQRDTLITENLIYQCTSQGIQTKLNNRVENNIIADIIVAVHNDKEVPPVYLKLREGPLTGGTIQRNILYHTGSNSKFYDQGRNRRLVDAWAHEADTDFNLYFSTESPNLAKATLKQARQNNIDLNSITKDPLFVDPANHDYRLHPNSPALKLGFTTFDFSQIGLKNNHLNSSSPSK